MRFDHAKPHRDHLASKAQASLQIERALGRLRLPFENARIDDPLPVTSCSPDAGLLQLFWPRLTTGRASAVLSFQRRHDARSYLSAAPGNSSGRFLEDCQEQYHPIALPACRNKSAVAPFSFVIILNRVVMDLIAIIGLALLALGFLAGFAVGFASRSQISRRRRLRVRSGYYRSAGAPGCTSPGVQAPSTTGRIIKGVRASVAPNADVAA
jgi:hypothetical protein